MQKLIRVAALIMAICVSGSAFAGSGGGTYPKGKGQITIQDFLPIPLGGGDGTKPGDKD